MRREITLPTEVHARIDVARAAGVTIGLGVTGAIAGAPLGTLLFAVMGLAEDGYDCYSYMPDVVLAGVIIGGGLGALVLPFSAWTLPRAPVGHILSATAAGTVVGTLAGALLMGLDALGPLLGAIIGFGSATSWLGFRTGTSFEAE